jgi:hypothetical protein
VDGGPLPRRGPDAVGGAAPGARLVPVIGFCEAEDEDSPETVVDLYMIRGETPAEDHSLWLCEQHRP